VGLRRIIPYARHLKILGELPGGRLRNETVAYSLLRGGVEREAVLDAVRGDPLLPERLFAVRLSGQHAWRRRVEVFRKAGRQLCVQTVIRCDNLLVMS